MGHNVTPALGTWGVHSTLTDPRGPLMAPLPFDPFSCPGLLATLPAVMVLRRPLPHSAVLQNPDTGFLLFTVHYYTQTLSCTCSAGP